MDDVNSSRIKQYFNIAFKVKNKAGDHGIKRNYIEKLIMSELGFVSQKAINREFELLIASKLIQAGLNGYKANKNLEEENQKFLKEIGDN